MEIKRLDNPGQYLLDTGLLWQINCEILHPLGLALEVVINEDGTASIGGIWDSSDDPEGILYDDNLFRTGLNKYMSFFEREGRKRHMTRYHKLGYIIQGKDPKKRDWNSEVR